MVPTAEIQLALATLLGLDTATLDAALDVEVVLIIAAFTPGPDLVIGDLVLATFDGYAAKARATGVNQIFADPETGAIVIQIGEPAGGWHWVTTGTTNLPQTVHGFGLTDSTGADLYGTALLDTPVVLTATGQGVDLDWVRFTVSPDALT